MLKKRDRRSRLLLLVAVAAVLVVLTALEGSPQAGASRTAAFRGVWQPSPDPMNPRHLVAFAFDSAAFPLAYSSDAGSTWRRLMGAKLPADESTGGVTFLGQRTLVTEFQDGTLHYSPDFGRSWLIAAAPTLPSAGGAIFADPGRPATAYACDGAALLVTTDLGRTWAKVSGYEGALGSCITVYAQPKPGGELIVATRSPAARTIAISRDGGVQWREVRLPFFLWTTSGRPSDYAGTGLVFDPARPASLLALGTGNRDDAFNGHPDHVWRSHDSGATWQMVGNVPLAPDCKPYDLGYSRSGLGVVATDCSDGSQGSTAFASTSNDGRSWQSLQAPVNWRTAFYFSGPNNNRLVGEQSSVLWLSRTFSDPTFYSAAGHVHGFLWRLTGASRSWRWAGKAG